MRQNTGLRPHGLGLPLRSQEKRTINPTMKRKAKDGSTGPHKVDPRLGDVDATRFHLDQAGTNPLSPMMDFDRLRKGRIEDGRRYLGNGAWQHLDHEHSETNERREGRP